MDKQLQNYILLKGISEKFNEVSKEITNEDIKEVILNTIKEKIEAEIESLDIVFPVQEIANNWIDKNSFNIEGMIRESLNRRLK